MAGRVSQILANRRLQVRGLGAAVLLAGVGAALIGPVEVSAFYLFVEGGRFHYEGFRFGSFMFAYIALQVAGYYGIAVVGTVLGYGLVRLRQWSHAVVDTLLWFWLIWGFPLTVVMIVMLVVSKKPSPGFLIAIAPLALIAYPVGPVLLVRALRSPGVVAAFEARGPGPSPLEAIPLTVRLAGVHLVGFILGLHFLLLLNSIFPWFGTFLSGPGGALAIGVLVVALVWLTWGLLLMKRWAWWAGMSTLGLITVSSAITFARHTLADVIDVVGFPAAEMVWFEGVPFLRMPYVALALVVPVLVALGLLLVSRRHYAA
jgi:hypothetical protein